jgi:chlorite dismutase
MSDAPAADLPVGYALWSVFRRPASPVAGFSDAVHALPENVTVRGVYDVSGLRADADVMLWTTGERAEELQAANRALRRSLGDPVPTWSALGVHRPAEFSRSHAPAFLRGLEPKQWVTVYPFVRSYDWYLLPEDERRTMLADHGRKGSEYPGVQANTVAAFALGDYEWLLPMESDTLVDLVDMMRALRSADARRHVREEVPFYTGRRIPVTDIPEVLQ